MNKYNFFKEYIHAYREGVKKLEFLGDMPPISGGGVEPPPAKKLKNCHPCLSTGSKEIFFKNGEQLLSPKRVEGGGGHVTHKVEFFFIDALPDTSLYCPYMDLLTYK